MVFYILHDLTIQIPEFPMVFPLSGSGAVNHRSEIRAGWGMAMGKITGIDTMNIPWILPIKTGHFCPKTWRYMIRIGDVRMD
jgi:hypothetical protein